MKAPANESDCREILRKALDTAHEGRRRGFDVSLALMVKLAGYAMYHPEFTMASNMMQELYRLRYSSKQIATKELNRAMLSIMVDTGFYRFDGEDIVVAVAHEES